MFATSNGQQAISVLMARTIKHTKHRARTAKRTRKAKKVLRSKTQKKGLLSWLFRGGRTRRRVRRGGVVPIEEFTGEEITYRRLPGDLLHLVMPHREELVDLRGVNDVNLELVGVGDVERGYVSMTSNYGTNNLDTALTLSDATALAAGIRGMILPLSDRYGDGEYYGPIFWDYTTGQHIIYYSGYEEGHDTIPSASIAANKWQDLMSRIPLE